MSYRNTFFATVEILFPIACCRNPIALPRGLDLSVRCSTFVA